MKIKLAHIVPIILSLLIFALTACEQGKYVGPSVAVNGTYNGIGVGVALYGQNPIVAATPAPTPGVTQTTTTVTAK